MFFNKNKPKPQVGVPVHEKGENVGQVAAGAGAGDQDGYGRRSVQVEYFGGQEGDEGHYSELANRRYRDACFVNITFNNYFQAKLIYMISIIISRGFFYATI